MKTSRRLQITHVVNPFDAPEGSDLVVAQPITFASMQVAAEFAAADADVTIAATAYPEDDHVAPEWVRRLGNLDRSILDVRSFASDRRLPLLADILARTAELSEPPDLIVYSNVDIAVMPQFYQAIVALFEAGHDGLVINRRTITTRWSSPSQLAHMYSEIGDPHPGRDCFVFTPQALAAFDLDEVIIGAGDVGRVLLWNIAVNAKSFLWLRDHHLTFHLGDDRSWNTTKMWDYHDHNNDVARRVFSRLEDRHGMLHGREPFASLLPRKPGYWAERRHWIEHPPTFTQRLIGRVRGAGGRILRRVGLAPARPPW